MNSTTIRIAEGIRYDGYYRLSTTLGEGGWAVVRLFASDWREYILLLDNEEEVDRIRAKDDKTALGAFDKLYALDAMLNWLIVERIVTWREVASQEKESK